MTHTRLLLLFIALWGCLAGAITAQSATWRERERVTLSLDGPWMSALDPQGSAPRDAWATTLPQAKRSVLPCRWDDEACTRAYAGAIWYSRTFVVPENAGRAGAVLVLKNTVGETDIFLDGAPRAHFLGNGLTRRVPLALASGATHRLTIRLARPASGAPVSCGLGPMTLECLPSARIETLTPYYTGDDTLTLRYRLSTEAPCKVTLLFGLTSLDGERDVAHAKPFVLDLPAGMTEKTITLQTKRCKRWSPDAPTLYRLRAELVNPGKTGDVYQVSYGFCTPTMSADGHLLINGAETILRGLRLPGGLPAHTTASLAQLCEEELRTAQRAGFNAVMGDGAALSDDVLTTADRLGMLVVLDVPPSQDHAATSSVPARPALQATLEALGHHPCIVAWSWESAGSAAEDAIILRRLDPLRLAIVRRETAGATLYAPSFASGQPIAVFDAARYTGQLPWDERLQLAETGKLPYLVCGTAQCPGTEQCLQGQQDEDDRLHAERLTIESVRRATYPFGYFLRPAAGGSYSGLRTTDGRLTRAYYAAVGFNQPRLLAVRVLADEDSYRTDARLINDLSWVGTCQLTRLLTSPDGQTQITRTDPGRDILITGARQQDLSEECAPFAPAVPGAYRIQYILSEGARVIALSQVITVTVAGRSAAP